MTSSLPDFSSGPTTANAAAPAALLPAAGASSPDSAASPDFAALMVSSSPAPAAAAAPAVAPAPSPAPSAEAANRLNLRILTGGAPVADPAPPPATPAVSIFGSQLVVTVSADGAAPVDASDEVIPPSGPREIPRDTLEEAATFVTSLLQSLLPEVQVRLSVPAGGPGTRGPADATQGTQPAHDPSFTASFSASADGAIELKLDLAQLLPLDPGLELPLDQSALISAEWQRPGETTVRLEAAAVAPATDTEPVVPPRAVAPGERAIFAAKFPGFKISLETPDISGERNFVFTGDKQVKSQSSSAGISVAKTEPTMPAALIEESRFSRKAESFSVLPLRAGFQVDVPPAERITDPAAVPAGQNFAGRAVDTVTSLVDTQFSASLQKSGSVQLRLRFGGEDLSVRVEVRDGNVRTDFHTDSAGLRSALSREWQAMVAQSPDQALRYLDPVFSPAPVSSPGSGSTEMSSSFTRQQQSQQEARTPRDPAADSASPFSRRSQLSDAFVPEPAVTRVAAFLPTSHRLSVLA